MLVKHVQMLHLYEEVQEEASLQKTSGEGLDEEEVEDIEDSENKILTVSSSEKKNKVHLESVKIKLEKAVKKLTLNRDEFLTTMRPFSMLPTS